MSRLTALVFTGSALLGAACARSVRVSTPDTPAAPPITDGRGVIRAMHQRYVGRFFSSLRFAQHTTTISESGRETKGIWNEYIALPGKLRIDFLPLSSHSGVLYTGGKIYGFTEGKAQPTQSGWNPLLTLIGDVYAQSPDTTIWQLDSLGFDLSRVRRDSWMGSPVWVVGAAAGDTTSSQFWIDRDSLLVRRVIQRTVRGANQPVVSDIRMLKYQDAGGYPVAFEIQFWRGGRMYFKEDYFDVRANVAIPAATFDPARWVVGQIKE
jgi:hypothetical protein